MTELVDDLARAGFREVAVTDSRFGPYRWTRREKATQAAALVAVVALVRRVLR